MTAEQEYELLSLALLQIEKRTGFYLHDEIVDAENSAEFEYGSDAFWTAMVASLKMAAGMRAEEDGENINTLIGRTIY